MEELWGYYKVRGRLTLNMMTIPRWHFHFLKRTILLLAAEARARLLIFDQIRASLLAERGAVAQIRSFSASSCLPLHIPGKKFPSPRLLKGAHMHEIRPLLSYTNVPSRVFFFFCGPFHFVLQTPSEVRPCSQAVGVADVFNGARFVSWWRDKHGGRD